MQPSSILCHAQEAQQRARAAHATLNNVRDQANTAAAAWAKEGLAAVRRERRKLAAAAGMELDAIACEEREFSENPDRGLVDGPAGR